MNSALIQPHPTRANIHAHRPNLGIAFETGKLECAIVTGKQIGRAHV